MTAERSAWLGAAVLAAIVLCSGLVAVPAAQARDRLATAGYLQGSLLHLAAASDRADQTEYRLHHRLNLRWDLDAELSLHGGLRTRLFAGDLVRNDPAYSAGLTRDRGLVDLSWTLVEQDSWLLHTIPDRLYLEQAHADWNLRVGRQRVNWGVNLITNPNDIFNMYSIYDVDYPERPGSDALRLQRFLAFNARVELAVSPARALRDSVAAALYAWHRRGYDVQLIAGYYRQQLALGGGWAGNLGGAGFKGETMLFHGTDREEERHQTNVVIATSVDYMFAGGLFLVGELLYNRAGDGQGFQLPAATISAANPSLARYQAAVQLAWRIHPLLNGALTGIYYPQQEALFLSPALTWSLTQNTDLQVLGQFFNGGSEAPFADAGNLLFGSLTYNF
ncbi:MAG: hypothetical protein R6W66_02705 [Pelovirga sp.]